MYYIHIDSLEEAILVNLATFDLLNQQQITYDKYFKYTFFIKKNK